MRPDQDRKFVGGQPTFQVPRVGGVNGDNRTEKSGTFGQDAVRLYLDHLGHAHNAKGATGPMRKPRLLVYCRPTYRSGRGTEEN